MALSSELAALFPHENSLENADLVRLELANALLATRTAEASLRSQLSVNPDAPDPVVALQDRLSELLLHVKDLRIAADEADAVVTTITAHMASIDRAKRNLEHTLSTFKRLSMLSASISQLRTVIPPDSSQATPQHYREAANVFQAASQLDTALKPFRGISRVSRLSAALSESSHRLRTSTISRFTSLFQPNTPVASDDMPVLQSAACLIDALGSEAQRETIDWFTHRALSEHRRIFRIQDEAGHLDNLPRRLASFRKVLRTLTESGNDQVFPASWNIQHALIASFNHSTRDDLATLLNQLSRSGNLHADLLYDSLNLTRDFEATLANAVSSDSYTHALSLAVDSHSHRTVAPMSSAFQPHLGLYIQSQARQMSDLFNTFSKLPSTQQGIQDDLDGAPEQTDVFPSSTKLFHFYRQTLDRCSKLSTESPLLELSNLLKRFLQRYVLEILVPATTHAKHYSFPLPKDRFDASALTNFCIALNTANYCAETTEQLQAKLKATMDPELSHQVDFEKEREMFTGCSARAILCLLRLLEVATLPSLAGMPKDLERFKPKIPSKSFAGGVSMEESEDHPFPNEPSTYLKPLLGSIRSWTGHIKVVVEHRTFLRTLFDKAVTLVVTTFLFQIARERPVTIGGAEQLLFDVQSLRACLATLPEIAPTPLPQSDIPQKPTSNAQPSSTATGTTSTIPPSYNRHVNKLISQLEALLKILKMPSVPHGSFVDAFLTFTGSTSFSDFQKVIELKGIARADENNLFDMFFEKSKDNVNTKAHSMNSYGGEVSTHSVQFSATLLSMLDMETNMSLPSFTLLSPLPTITATSVSSTSTSSSSFGVSSKTGEPKKKASEGERTSASTFVSGIPSFTAAGRTNTSESTKSSTPPQGSATSEGNVNATGGGSGGGTFTGGEFWKTFGVNTRAQMNTTSSSSSPARSSPAPTTSSANQAPDFSKTLSSTIIDRNRQSPALNSEPGGKGDFTIADGSAQSTPPQSTPGRGGGGGEGLIGVDDNATGTSSSSARNAIPPFKINTSGEADGGGGMNDTSSPTSSSSFPLQSVTSSNNPALTRIESFRKAFSFKGAPSMRFWPHDNTKSTTTTTPKSETPQGDVDPNVTKTGDNGDSSTAPAQATTTAQTHSTSSSSLQR